MLQGTGDSKHPEGDRQYDGAVLPDLGNETCGGVRGWGRDRRGCFGLGDRGCLSKNLNWNNLNWGKHGSK